MSFDLRLENSIEIPASKMAVTSERAVVGTLYFGGRGILWFSELDDKAIFAK